ncbi:hypothetical protein WSM22_46810 [Cytophagales bacterium WSM2-2]|nr:hypothetical protein WSM22_46810 [Cytophagales bacterium WSM2-2]
MGNQSETGHAKNVGAFKKLELTCIGFGSDYKPFNDLQKISSISSTYTTGKSSLQNVKNRDTSNKNKGGIRRVSFREARKLSRRIVNALKSSGAPKETIENALAVYRKIMGRRAKAIKKPGTEGQQPTPAPAKTISVSQMSFDNMVEHFSQLVEIVEAESAYSPNEPELQPGYLRGLVVDLSTKNAEAIAAAVALNNARIERDVILYAPYTGMLDIAQGVKNYVMSAFKPESAQYKQVSKIKFVDRKKK